MQNSINFLVIHGEKKAGAQSAAKPLLRGTKQVSKLEIIRDAAMISKALSLESTKLAGSQ